MSKNENNSILNLPLEEIMGERFGRYSKYIIQERALPDARDGLKPVQRRILYAMNKDGNTSEKPYRKSVKTVGLVIGNYHPHGDSSVYEAMVRMSQDWKLRYPLIDMHGNNGSIDDDPAAAMRYTEARLAKLSQELLVDIEKETVLFAPNFDDTENEPTVLPAKFPNLLVNGATGIAAGYATNICSHNLNEVIDATIYRIDHTQCDVKDILKFIKGPDFPTGGIVQGKQGIIDAFETGKGKIVLRGKVDIKQAKNVIQLIITEIPYEVVKSSLVKKIDDIRYNKEIEGILDVRDESDRSGLKIVIDLKKDSNYQAILNYLYKNTDLQIFYNYNMVSIVDKRPVLQGIIPLIDAYISHRKEVITKRTKYDLEKAQNRMHIVEGLIKAISVLDEVIEIIRASKDKKDAENNLISRFNFSSIQAESIATLRLYRLTSTDVTLLEKESEQLKQLIDDYQQILSSEAKLLKIMKTELKEIGKQYQENRKTLIEDEIEEIVIDKMAMIAAENVIVTITKDAYIKKISLRSYNSSDKSKMGIKDKDYLVTKVECSTLDTLLLFTNKGNYLFVPVYQIEEAKYKDIGKHISQLVKVSGEEKIVSAIVVSDFNSKVDLVLSSKNGVIKRTNLKEFEVQRYSKAISCMKLKEDDELMNVAYCDTNDQVILITNNGYAVKYDIEQIPSIGIKAAGVKSMNLRSEETVAVCLISHNPIIPLALFTNRGGSKRIRITDINNYNRPAKGEMLYRQTKTNPHFVVAGTIVNSNDLVNIYQEDDNILEVIGKDIPYMAKDGGLSTVSKQQLTSNLIKNTDIINGFGSLIKVEKEEKAEFEFMTLDDLL